MMNSRTTNTWIAAEALPPRNDVIASPRYARTRAQPVAIHAFSR
jgi:hypothetical protein